MDNSKVEGMIKDIRQKAGLLDKNLEYSFTKLINQDKQENDSNSNMKKRESSNRKHPNTYINEFVAKFKTNNRNKWKKRTSQEWLDEIDKNDSNIYGKCWDKAMPTQEEFCIFVQSIKYDDKTILEQLQDRPKLAFCHDYTGLTGLHWACIKGNYSLVVELIKMRIDVNKCDLLDRTALYFAVLDDNLEIVRVKFFIIKKKRLF